MNLIPPSHTHFPLRYQKPILGDLRYGFEISFSPTKHQIQLNLVQVIIDKVISSLK